MSYLYLGPITGNKKRIVGLTAEKPWADNLLVMHKLQTNILDDVSHNPVSSSDEFLSELSDGVIDDLAPLSKKLETSDEASSSTSERGRQPFRSSPMPQLDVDKSNIPSTSFFAGGRSSGLSGSQSFKRPFHAMNDGAMDEDERTQRWGTKKPKTKKLYGQGRGIESIRGSQTVNQEPKKNKTNGAGRSQGKPQSKGGLFL